MKWEFENDRTIYSQIIDRLRMFIVSGVLSPGEKLKSVREFASEAGVNPNTMQKALTELEKQGLVYTNRTSGRFVTEDEEIISNTRNEFAQARIDEFFSDMGKLGFSESDIKSIIDRRNVQ